MNQHITNNIRIIKDDSLEELVACYKILYKIDNKEEVLGWHSKHDVEQEYPHVFEWARDTLISLEKGRADQYEVYAAITVLKELLNKEAEREADYVVPK